MLHAEKEPLSEEPVPSFDLPDQKHLGLDARRRRFDPKSRHGAFGGRSTVRTQPALWMNVGGGRDIFLKVSRPRDEDGNVLVTDIDQQLPHLMTFSGENDGDSWRDSDSRSVGHIYDLPQLLEAQCVNKSTGRDRGNPEIIVTTYQVPGTSWLAAGEEERAKLEARREGRLSLAVPSAHGLRTVCRLRDTPVEKVGGLPSLLDNRSKFSCSDKTVDCSIQTARVLSEKDHSCWCAPDGDHCRDYLQVDLGESCQVYFISTQGRFPPVLRTDEKTGTRIVHEGSTQYLNWVKSYEVSYRVVSGHEWIPLAEFKGNSDMTTEVAHGLSPFTQAGGFLECRYLRFRPLTYQRKPAMRVGVYGHRPGKSGSGGKDAAAAHGENVVTFQVCHIKEGANLRRAPFAHKCAAGCAKCTKYRGICAGRFPLLGVRRKRFKEGVLEEVQQISSEGWSSLAPLADDEDYDEVEGKAKEPDLPGGPSASSAPEAQGAEAAGSAQQASPPPPPAQPAIPRLLRTRSRSDPDLSLSRAPSSSLGGDESLGSFMPVEETEGLLNFDLDEWVHL